MSTISLPFQLQCSLQQYYVHHNIATSHCHDITLSQHDMTISHDITLSRPMTSHCFDITLSQHHMTTLHDITLSQHDMTTLHQKIFIFQLHITGVRKIRTLFNNFTLSSINLEEIQSTLIREKFESTATTFQPVPFYFNQSTVVDFLPPYVSLI